MYLQVTEGTGVGTDRRRRDGDRGREEGARKFQIKPVLLLLIVNPLGPLVTSHRVGCITWLQLPSPLGVSAARYVWLNADPGSACVSVSEKGLGKRLVPSLGRRHVASRTS